MAHMHAPEVRSQFAQRLKLIRTQRGFDRARYFARTLGIEENRYTRYERAEVEPSLTLIHKICTTLGVSPNELMGFAEPKRWQAPGLAEPEADLAGGHAGLAEDGSGPAGSLAWNLAAHAAAIRHQHGGKGKPAGDPLAALRDTGVLYQSLQGEPFETIARIVNDDSLKDLDAKRKATLAELIDAFTSSLTTSPPPPRRRR